MQAEIKNLQMRNANVFVILPYSTRKRGKGLLLSLYMFGCIRPENPAKLLELLDQLRYLVHAAAAVGTCAGGFLNGFECCIASFYSGLDITDSDIAAEAYSLC